jgi:hypothetical protein
MAQGITPGRYDPDVVNLPVGSDVYNDATGYMLPQNEPMDDAEFRYIVFQAIEDSQTYIDSYLAPEREQAMSYYLGDEFGNEEEGRSRVVLTEVRDTVLAMLPSLLRIFTGGDKVIEFVPKNAEDVEGAEQATDLINYVFMQENPGFRILHDAMKDALILKTGVLTWYKIDEESVEYYDYSGLMPEEIALLTSDPDVSVESMTEVIDMITGMNKTDLRIRRVKRTPRYVVECIPPEQFLIDNEATCIDGVRPAGDRGERRNWRLRYE